MEQTKIAHDGELNSNKVNLLIPMMRSKKMTSCTWNYFTRTYNGLAVCNICKKTLSYKTTISNLKRHLIKKHPNVLCVPRPSIGSRRYIQNRVIRPNCHCRCMSNTDYISNTSHMEAVEDFGENNTVHSDTNSSKTSKSERKTKKHSSANTTENQWNSPEDTNNDLLKRLSTTTDTNPNICDFSEDSQATEEEFQVINEPEPPTKKQKTTLKDEVIQILKANQQGRDEQDAVRRYEQWEKSRACNPGLYSFFVSMYETTVTLPPHIQCEIKKGLFQLVMNFEEKANLEFGTSSNSSHTNTVRTTAPVPRPIFTQQSNITIDTVKIEPDDRT